MLRGILEELVKLNYMAKGEVWPAEITVTSSAVLTIDFEDGIAKLSTPDPTFSQNIIIPQAKLLALTIINDGPNPIQYATNKSLNSGMANATLKKGESTVLDFKRPCVIRVNLLAIDGNAQVRLVGLI